MLGEGGSEVGLETSYISVGRLQGTAIERMAFIGDTLVAVMATQGLMAVDRNEYGTTGAVEKAYILRLIDRVSARGQWRDEDDGGGHEDWTNLAYPLCRNRRPLVTASLTLSRFGLSMSACAPIG